MSEPCTFLGAGARAVGAGRRAGGRGDARPARPERSGRGEGRRARPLAEHARGARRGAAVPAVDVPRELVLPGLRAVAGDEGLQAGEGGDGALPVVKPVPVRKQAVAFQKERGADLPQPRVRFCRRLHSHRHVHVTAIAPLYSAVVNDLLRAEVLLNRKHSTHC